MDESFINAKSSNISEKLSDYKQSITMENIIQTASKLGLDGIELQDDPGFNTTFPNVPEKSKVKEIKVIADSFGIEIPVMDAMTASFLEPNIEDHIEYYRQWLELASLIDVNILKISLGKKSKDMSNEKAFKLVERGLEKTLGLSEEYGIQLAPELWPQGFPAGDSAAIVTLKKLIDSESFGHTIDNELIPADWGIEAYRLLSPYVIHVHVSTYEETFTQNSDISKFSSLEKKPLDLFTIDAFKEYISILNTVNYDGYLMIEWRGEKDTIDRTAPWISKSATMLRNIL